MQWTFDFCFLIQTFELWNNNKTKGNHQNSNIKTNTTCTPTPTQIIMGTLSESLNLIHFLYLWSWMVKSKSDTNTVAYGKSIKIFNYSKLICYSYLCKNKNKESTSFTIKFSTINLNSGFNLFLVCWILK